MDIDYAKTIINPNQQEYLFDKSLKLGWLRRYLTSKGKWRVFLDMEDFHDIFNYGPDSCRKNVRKRSNTLLARCPKGFKNYYLKVLFVMTCL